MSQIATILVDYRDYKAPTRENSGLSYIIAHGIACPAMPDMTADKKDGMSEIIRYVTDVDSAAMAVKTANTVIALTDAVQRSFGEYLRTSMDMRTCARTSAAMTDIIERMLHAYASDGIEENPEANIKAIGRLASIMDFPSAYMDENGITWEEPFRHQLEQEIIGDIRLALAGSVPDGNTSKALDRFASDVQTATVQRTEGIVRKITELRSGILSKQ